MNVWVIVSVLGLLSQGFCPSVTKLYRIPAQTRSRVAILGFRLFGRDAGQGNLKNVFEEALGRDPRVVLVDDGLTRSALLGVGYDGSLNMTKDQARKVGGAIGCDFFITGKAEVLSRSEREKESHEVAYIAVFIVDGRSGALQNFDMISSKGSTGEAALSGAVKALFDRTPSYVDQIASGRRVFPSGSGDTQSGSPKRREPVEEIPTEGSPQAVGFNSPVFLNRVKPDYPTEADLADVTATVEAMVVFQSNGEVGNIEITRWGGFGLEAAAERAIRQLKFKPAQRDGKPVSVRALIQYNFRKHE